MSSPLASHDYAALPLTKRSTASKDLAFAIWFVFLSGVSGISAYYHALTGFAPWDDEGSLMVTVKQYLAGMKLYSQIPVPYGPVYYFYNWAARTVSGTPEIHDVVRISELLPWLLTAFVAAWIVFRLTSSIALASVAHVAVFRLLWSCFYYEAGHTQELTILLLVSLAAAGVVASTARWRFLGVILVGALTAGLLLVRSNSGVFAILATSLAVSAYSPKTKLSQLAFYASAAASLLLPIVLMKARLSDWPTQMFAALVLLSTMAALLVLVRAPRARCFTLLDSVAAIGAFVLFCLVVTVILKIQGVLLSRAIYALFLQPLGPLVVQSTWYVPLPFAVRREWPLWITAGLFLAGYFSQSLSKQRRESGLAVLKFLLVLFAAVDLLYGVYPYLLNFGIVPDFFFLIPPFGWLLLYWNTDEDGYSYSFARTLLCVLAILQMLHAYPVAGSQVTFVEVLPIIALMIFLSDFLAWYRKRLGSPSETASTALRALSSGALVCVAVFYFSIAGSARKAYKSLPSLQLPGAGKIHLPDAQAQDYRWLVRQLDSHCDVFVGVPEVPSLHIWTGKDPLSGMDIDDWMISMPDERQLAASELLSEHPNACAVYNQELVDFWDRPHHDLSSLPLVSYITHNFKVVGTTGKFSLLVKKERDVAAESFR
jgi:hypothetical protein